MKCIAPMVTLVLLFGAVGMADEVKWKKYANAAGGYSVLLPKEPTEQSQEVNTPIGPIKVTMEIAELDADNAYMLAVNDYPEAARNAPVENVLDGAIKGAVGDGKLISSEKITLKGTKVSGRDVIFVKNGIHGRMHIFLSGVRLYQVMALAKEDKTKSKETEAFFESFEIKTADK